MFLKAKHQKQRTLLHENSRVHIHNTTVQHTVNIAQCGNYGNLLSRNFGKNFVKVTVLLNELLKSWFDEIFFDESKFFIFPNCVEKTVNAMWLQNSQSSLCSNFLYCWISIFAIKYLYKGKLFSFMLAWNLAYNPFWNFKE